MSAMGVLRQLALPRSAGDSRLDETEEEGCGRLPTEFLSRLAQNTVIFLTNLFSHRSYHRSREASTEENVDYELARILESP